METPGSKSTGLSGLGRVPRSWRSREALRFRGYRFEPATGELRRGREIIPMRPKAAEALAALTAMPGRLVGRDELRRRIWGDTQVEWETGLHQVIRQLRRALEDEASSPSFIQTVPRQGYRFIAPIEGEPPGHASAAIRRPLSAIALVALGAFGFPAAVILLCILFAS